MHSVRIDSDPQNARYSITDEAGERVATGTTPDSVTLRTSSGVFQRSRYVITYESPDYESQTNSLNATLSPWYLANILFSVPGFVGLLVVDPFTGALYRLPDEASVVFGTKPAGDSDLTQTDGAGITHNEIIVSDPAVEKEAVQ